MGLAFDYVCSRRWVIQEETLTLMVAIAQRLADAPELVAAKTGQRLENTRQVTMRDGIAIVPVVGPIFRRADMFSEISGATATATLASDIAAAAANPDVQGILLEIDSPGGEAAGIHELANQVAALRGQKPIVAYIDSVAASGAYWLAAACDEIVLDKTAFVGSIGAVMSVANPAADDGSRIEFVSSQSPKKRVNPTTKAGKTEIQTLVDDLGAIFVASVAEFRGVDEETVISDFGGGGMKIAEKAIAAGMADRLGTFEETLADMATAAGDDPATAGHPPTQARAQTRRHTEDPMTRQLNVSPTIRERMATFFFGSGDLEGVPLTSTLEQTDGPPAKGEQIASQALPPATYTLTGNDPRDDEIKRLKAELATSRTESSSERVKRIETRADAFADEQIRASRALPAERSELILAYKQAVADDDKLPIVAGPDGSGRTRVAALEALITARPQHKLTSEHVRSNTSLILPDRQPASDEQAEVRAEAAAYAAKQNGQGSPKK